MDGADYIGRNLTQKGNVLDPEGKVSISSLNETRH